MDWIRRQSGICMQEKSILQEDGSCLVTLEFPQLAALPEVEHCFSTRYGGVSEGMFRSMNLSVRMGDTPENVEENFTRILKSLGSDLAHMVSTAQTHTTNVRVVTGEDARNWNLPSDEYTDVDGIITNEPGLTLAAFGSDCCVLYFVDSVHHAIGLSHSGWKGTVSRMGQVTVEAMGEAFGTKPKDLICAVGPSICRECYEVSEDVAVRFQEEFPEHIPEIMDEKSGGKYQLDLHAANRIVLEEAGVRPENISVTDICTMCNSEGLFSHRKTQGKRGNNAALLKWNG